MVVLKVILSGPYRRYLAPAAPAPEGAVLAAVANYSRRHPRLRCALCGASWPPLVYRAGRPLTGLAQPMARGARGGGA